MFHTMRQFMHEVSMLSGKNREKFEQEVQRQKDEFSKESPSLTEKREKAIAYLGDKWIIKEKNYPRRVDVSILRA